MIDAIVVLVAAFFFFAALAGCIKFWLRFEEFSDRLDYIETDLRSLQNDKIAKLFAQKQNDS